MPFRPGGRPGTCGVGVAPPDAADDSEKQSPVLSNPDLLWSLALIVAKAHELGFVFTSTQEFADFVKDPIGTITQTMAQASAAGGGTNAAAQALPGLPPIKGVKLDKLKLDQIATAGPRRTYRIEAWGEINRDSAYFPNLRRTLTAVWDTTVQPQNYRPPANISAPVPKGAYVFLREE